MQLIASYPIAADACLPYCGKPVVGVTCYGDSFVGVLDGVRNGYAYFKPIGGVPAGQILSVKKRAVRAARANQSIRKSAKRASIKAFGFPGFFPGFGFGFAAAALAFTIPLFLLASLFFFPFFI